jgi:hypothetical protein
MQETRLPTLWIYGPPGVGKSVIGWKLFEQIAAGGTPVGYVDIDQLGICYGPPKPGAWAPEPSDDPGRHRMKARNLDAVAINQMTAGAQLLVVSGVVDAQRGIDHELLPHVAVRALRLRADAPELRRRLQVRGRPSTDLARELAYADQLDRLTATEDCVDTTELPVADVLKCVTTKLDGWPDQPVERSTPADRKVDTLPGEALFVSGVTGVGKSAVGWQVYERVRTSGIHAACVDLEQIGFYRAVPSADPRNLRLKAANLAALWRTYHAAGAKRLVVIGAIDSTDEVYAYTNALPSVSLTVCRLHANRGTLRARTLQRGRGIGVDLAGDPLTGQPEAVLSAVADRAAGQAHALDQAGVGDVRINTDGRDVDDIAGEIMLVTRFADVGRSELR